MLLKLKKALLIADPQNDFCPGGALGIRGADKIIPAVNKYIKYFSARKFPVFITRDWHPGKTAHFKQFGGPWPKHCVQETKGARFHPALRYPKESIILSKGMDPSRDSYSAFDAVDPHGLQFAELLKMWGIKELFIGGLATDYCVKYSALEALRSGFKVNLLLDAVKGVDLKPGDSVKAVEEAKRSGAKTVTFKELKK